MASVNAKSFARVVMFMAHLKSVWTAIVSARNASVQSNYSILYFGIIELLERLGTDGFSKPGPRLDRVFGKS